MRSQRELGSSGHAITDLYDEQRRTFLVQYPIWLITLLGLAGVAAFAVTGFLGYSNSSPVRQPWPLFLWFCALLLTLQVSIFRDVSLRRRLIAILFISFISIIFIGITYFNASLPAIIRNLLQNGRIFKFLVQQSATYTIINFGLIAIFWADTVRRWVRRSRGLPPNPRVRLGIEQGAAYDEDLPTMSELVSGDLIAGAVLTLLLAVTFRPDVVGSIIHPQGIAPLTTCTFSWPLGACHGYGGGISDPPTLFFMDLIQSLLYLPLGLITLALSATVSGLGAVGGVNAKEAMPDSPETTATDKGQSSTVPIAVDVTTTVLNALRSALDRRLRLLLRNFALSLRMIGWPTLIVGATYGLAELSTNVQNYLHSGRTLNDAFIYVLPGAAWGVLATLGVVISAALMLFRFRVFDNTLRFLGLVGFIVLLTFWLFSLALWAFNQLLLQTHASVRHPFDPPSSPTALSFLALVVFGFLLLLRRARAPGSAPGPTRRPIAVGGGTMAQGAADADANATRAAEAPPPPPS